jgi:D-alanyl-D-alanine carboxypeptidase (penicillin-binding protein 5/6)
MSSRALRAIGLAAMWAIVGMSPVAAQRSASIPPPTPVPPDGSPSPYPTALATPPPSAELPEVDAATASLADLDSGRVLFQKEAKAPRPIASLTKIMTALLVIERTRPTEIVEASENASAQSGAELGLQPGERRTVRELLIALLLQSANDAAVALAEHVSGTVEVFVDAMNQRAIELGMRNTEFRSPSGLDDSGHSTARDLLRLASEAFLDPTFAEIAATRFAKVPSDDGEPRRLQNRNALLWLYEGTIGGKTGYTGAAGFCLVAAAERDGLRLATVVLGAPEQAFSQAAEILNHGFAAWEREPVVGLGDPLDPFSIDGATVPVEADATLSVLVPEGSVVESEIEQAPGLSLPVEQGEVVGSLEATSAGQVLGEVELIAAESVEAEAPRPEESDSFLMDLWEALAGLYGRVYEVLDA